MGRPKLIIFDLDHTLWPFWVDSLVRNNSFKVNQLMCYPEVPHILWMLKANGFLLGVASSTSAVAEAVQLIYQFGWQMIFDYIEVYEGNKKIHFTNIHLKSGIQYRDMLFFDDKQRNLRDVRQLGVTCVPVREGMSLYTLGQGLILF